MSCPHGVDTYIHRCGTCDTIGAIRNAGPSFAHRVYERAVAHRMATGTLSRADCGKYLEEAKLAARVLDEAIMDGRESR